MDQSLVAISVAFAMVVATVALVTRSRRGPFAVVLARLHADQSSYSPVTTLLFGVVIGLLALPVLAWRWPTETAMYGAVGFILFPALLGALRATCRHRGA